MGLADFRVLALPLPPCRWRPFRVRIPLAPWARLLGRAPLPGPGSPDPRRAQCPSPTASGASAAPSPASSGPRSPRVRRARRCRGTLARTPPPGRRRRLTCPSGSSACPGRRPPDAPDPAAGTSSGRPHPLPRAVSFSSTGVWGRRRRPRPPRPPSSGLLEGERVAGGGGVRLGALSPPPRAPALFYDHCERAVAVQPRRRAAAAWRAPRCLALLQHRKGNQVKLCRNSAPAPAWPRVRPQPPAGAQRTLEPPPARRPRWDAGPQAAAAAAGGRRLLLAARPALHPRSPHTARLPLVILSPSPLFRSLSLALSAAAGGAEPLLAETTFPFWRASGILGSVVRLLSRVQVGFSSCPLNSAGFPGFRAGGERLRCPGVPGRGGAWLGQTVQSSRRLQAGKVGGVGRSLRKGTLLLALY